MQRVFLVTMLSLTALVGSARADDNQAWQRIHEERGILVSTQPQPGQDLPAFRGQTTIHAPVLHLLAVLLDDTRSAEWAKGAEQTRVVRRIDAHTVVVYARSRQPWPVRDRDIVMLRRVDVLRPNHSYRVHLECVPNEQPEQADYVRIRQCETSFELRALDATTTAIDYRVHADPGGHFPTWIVRAVSKNIPLETLDNLVRQVEKTRGKYEDAVAVWKQAAS